jgi:hypothetical protein
MRKGRGIGAAFFLGVVLAALAVSPASRAAVSPLLSSGTGGPTILIINDATKGDLSVGMALRQVASWSLTRGRIVTGTPADAAAAVRSERPAAVIALRTSRSKDEHASLATRGLDAKPLLTSLRPLVDDKGEPLVEDGADALPATPAGVQAVRLSLVIKNGGTVPAARSRLFRNAVHAVLVAHDMTRSDPWTLVRRDAGVINVALYVGQGASATPGVFQYPNALASNVDVRCTFVGAAEIARPGLLRQFDVLIFPGGMGNSQGETLGQAGSKAVIDFVRAGGGYVSSCAGSYLAATGYKWSLRLINAQVLDYKHWLRGTGDVDIELTDEGRQILGDVKGLFKVHYANGPLLAAANEAGLAAFTPLAYFRSDMAKSAPGGVMPNTPAIIAGAFGEGRVLCFSPHPEYTKGLESFVGRAVRWVAKRPVATAQAASPIPASPAAASPVAAKVTLATAESRHTPFVTVLTRNWPRWDANHDDILAADEIDRAVADPAMTGDDAAAAAAIKLLSRTTKVTEPLTRAYFRKYDAAALAVAGTDRLADAERNLPDPAAPPDAPVPSPSAAPTTSRASRLPADFDLTFVKAKARIARRGEAPQWPADVTATAALDRMSQGPLGDCFFVASIGSTVVHRPAALREMVQLQPDGRYRAAFPFAQPFTFPGLTDGQVALGSTTAGDGAWLAVLEQAFGKYRSALRGQSTDVDGTEILRRGGDSAVTIQQLTGHATRRIPFPASAERRAAQRDAILPDVRAALRANLAAGRLITAGIDPPAKLKPNPDGTPATGTLPKIPPGFQKKHVYAVVAYDPATDVVEIWNPHGQTFRPKRPAGLANGYETRNGRFNLPLADAFAFYTSFTFELDTPAPKPRPATAPTTRAAR